MRQVTAIVERKGGGYVSWCPDLDVVSQGGTIEAARNNLQEAVELFLETAAPTEIEQRMHSEVFVTGLDVEVGGCE